MRKAFLALLTLLCLCGLACADTLSWPSTVAVIEDETFMGSDALDEVVIPAGVTSIGARAFADSSLQRLSLPGNASIGENAFDGCGIMTVDVPSGSANAAYATQNLQLQERIYKAGTWVCGVDLAPNVYIIRPLSGCVATISVRSSSIRTYTFSGSMILRLNKGETLVLRSATAQVDYEFDQYHTLEPAGGQGMLRVGQDIPAGDYAVNLTGTAAGVITWYRDAGLSVLRSQTIDDEWLSLHGVVTLSAGELIGYTGLSFPGGDRRTVRRALIIGQTYPGQTSYALDGPATDQQAMATMLVRLSGTPFTCVKKSNLTASGILSAIATTFADADGDDISLFYYSGHGTRGGNLRGNDGAYVTPAQLRQALDKIPGIKILVVDCCYSGGMIKSRGFLGLMSVTEETVTDSSAQAFVSSFNSAFMDDTVVTVDAPALMTMSLADAAGEPDGDQSVTAKGFNERPYYVITSCAADELCYERQYTIGGQTVYSGLFTSAVCLGCGWDVIQGRASGSSPAANRDGNVTLAGLYNYARNWVTAAGTLTPQTVSAYPSASGYVLFIP